MKTTLFREHRWVIMSKDRTLVAKGIPKDRWLVRADDTKNKQRILTYDTENKARAGFIYSGFYSDYIPRRDENGDYINQDEWRQKNLEAVPVIITIKEIVDGKDT